MGRGKTWSRSQEHRAAVTPSLPSWVASPHSPQLLSYLCHSSFLSPSTWSSAFILTPDLSLTISDGASLSLRDLRVFLTVFGIQLRLAFRALHGLAPTLSVLTLTNIQATIPSLAHPSGSLTLGLFVQFSACNGLLPPLH